MSDNSRATAGERFQRLVDIMARLRGANGCPWDREQTFDTIKPYLLEETYEVMESIDARDWPALADELGDLLLQSVFFAQMASEQDLFRIDDSLDAINNKLIRRHPHVFGDGDAKTADQVRQRWDEIKSTEKSAAARKHLLDGVSRSQPALAEAQQISSRVAGVGFDWENIEQVINKLHEELDELAEARSESPGANPAIENEIGDILFVIVNIARHLKVDAEQALRKANAKFRSRFSHIEQSLQESGRPLPGATLEEMEALLAGSETTGSPPAGGRAAVIEYRPLHAFQELEEAVEVQRKVWGFSDVEIVPSRLFLLAAKIGGQAIGAFDGNQLVGFCLSIPGLKSGGKMYLHSHMLGVLEPYRDRGVGRRLKLEQRKDALSRGVDLIEWTFDPLELKNAFLNIERLGIIVRRYVPNQYGITTSKLHGGMPTDRCVAEWMLDRPRTVAILEGRSYQRELVSVRIEVPSAIQKLRHDDVKSAIRIQQSISKQFLDSFDRGLAVTGFERTDEKGTYLLSPWE